MRAARVSEDNRMQLGIAHSLGLALALIRERRVAMGPIERDKDDYDREIDRLLPASTRESVAIL